MESILGNSLAVTVGLTIVLFGLGAFLMGQAIAETWRPAWQVTLYAALLGLANRFLAFALFGGQLLSITGYLIDAAILIGIASLAYRLTRAHKMVVQYPWLYERAGPFTWRAKT